MNKDLFKTVIVTDSKENNIESLDSKPHIYINNELMLKKLNQNLNKAIEFEEYEKAAKLRDEIDNFKKNIKA